MSRTILAIVATTERQKKLAEIGYWLGRETFEDVPGT
jgi:hypothetical protein